MTIEFNNRPTCSACKAEKRETNHWYLIFADEVEGIQMFAVSEWDDAEANKASACSCGETCTHTLLSRWLATRTLSAPSTRSEPHAPQGETHV